MLSFLYNFLRLHFRMRLIMLASCCLSACSVPNHMHVTEGVSPHNVDTNVRFRTTYYFRVFDYCWSTNAPLEQNLQYQKVIPESDTVYRYRMTGKASALSNIIKFESGSLSASQIDPFGKRVSLEYDAASDSWTGQASASDPLTVPSEGIATPSATAPDKATERQSTCPQGQILKRGFQTMGPEGMKPFDQEQRLVLAMYSDAKPLIETLQEYSGRILAPAIDPASRAALDLESARTIKASRLLASYERNQQAGTSKPAVESVFQEVLATMASGETQP